MSGVVFHVLSGVGITYRTLTRYHRRLCTKTFVLVSAPSLTALPSTTRSQSSYSLLNSGECWRSSRLLANFCTSRGSE